MSKKEKFALYLTPEKKALLERRYQEDGSRSLTGFIERAIDFYLDYLSAGDAGLFLPLSSLVWTAGWISWRTAWPRWPSGRRWRRTWWPASWRTPVSLAGRSCAAGGRRACTM